MKWKSFRKDVPEKGRVILIRFCCGIDKDTREDEYYYIIGERINDEYYRQFDNCPYRRDDLDDWVYIDTSDVYNNKPSLFWVIKFIFTDEYIMINTWICVFGVMLALIINKI